MRILNLFCSVDDFWQQFAPNRHHDLLTRVLRRIDAPLLVPLVAYLHTQLGRCTGISFIDSTSLAVCHTARIHQHRVFAGRAARGKTSVGWFFGFNSP